MGYITNAMKNMEYILFLEYIVWFIYRHIAYIW